MLNMLFRWRDNHFGQLWNIVLVGGAQNDYQKMRAGLTTAILSDSYSGYTDGSAGNYTSRWWYDEYSVNLQTGQATGDASRNGYLGDPTGSPHRVTGSADPAVWRRNFQNGIVLRNYTGSAQTVNLGGTFRRIRGTQAPSVNNGQSVTSVSLPANDGLILLR